MLNEITPGIFSNSYHHGLEPGDEDLFLCYRDNQVLLKKSGDDYEIPRKKDFTILVNSPVYLFSLNSSRCFGLFDPETDHGSFEYQDLFVLRNWKNREFAWIASLGHQLMSWYQNNRFCGRCGSETELKQDERAILCPKCNRIIYPAISPAVIVAITCGDQLLLAKGKNYRGDFYALIAGYVDMGETIEEAVFREVKEEVGLDIHNLKYYKSQPWPFSGSLMLGFSAEADASQPLIIDEHEIKEAGWFSRGNLPSHPSGISISGDLIDAFEEGLF
jgi:NAD+ diphosphatase